MRLIISSSGSTRLSPGITYTAITVARNALR